MVTALTGHFGLPLENGKTLVANSSTFQTWTGAANAAAAEAFAHIFIEADANVTLPAVFINWSDGAQWRSNSMGDGHSYGPRVNGNIQMVFQAEQSPLWSVDPDECARVFTEVVDGIIGDMVVLNGTNDFLIVQAFSPMVGAPQPTLQDKGHETPTLTWPWELEL
jgi:hypothetical protein